MSNPEFKNQEKVPDLNNNQFESDFRAKEKPKEDLGYFVDVNRHFKGFSNIDSQDKEFAGYLEENRKKLLELAKNENLNNLDPDDYNFALSQLAFEMYSSGQYYRVHGERADQISDEVLQQEKRDEQQYNSAKGLWMRSMKKIYPELNGGISTLRSKFKNGVGNAYHKELSEEDIRNLEKNNPQELIHYVDEFIFHIQGELGAEASSLYSGEVDEESKAKIVGDLQIGNQELYELQLTRDRLAEKIYGNAAASVEESKQLNSVREQINPKASEKSLENSEVVSSLEAERVDLGNAGFFKDLYDSSANDLNAVKKIVTPQMKEQFLKYLLYEVDLGIKGAEEFVSTNPNMAVNRKTVLQFCGNASQYAAAPVFQKMLAAASGRIYSPEEISRMPMKDYVNMFGYDLHSDTKRKELLDKYTNALE